MKGNAKRNGEARTREMNPHSVPGGTGSGRIVVTGDGSQEDEARKADAAKHKQRPLTKGQARLARRVKQFELYATGAVAEKRKTEGSYTEVYRPGSLNK